MELMLLPKVKPIDRAGRRQQMREYAKAVSILEPIESAFLAELFEGVFSYQFIFHHYSDMWDAALVNAEMKYMEKNPFFFRDMYAPKEKEP